jgi:hypothetical protein
MPNRLVRTVVSESIILNFTLCRAPVMMKVWMGLMLGRMAKTVSPTRPLEADATPASLMGTPRPVCLTSAGKYQGIILHACGGDAHWRRTRSRAVTIAHTFGAQYA